MNNIHTVWNYAEALIWFVVAGLLIVGGISGSRLLRSPAWQASVAFLVFGLSDLIEVRTGAWWRPWWLLVIKAACVAVLCISYVRYRAHVRRPKSSCEPVAEGDAEDRTP